MARPNGLCFLMKSASHSRRLAGSFSCVIILASMFWVLRWHIMRCFFRTNCGWWNVLSHDRVGIVLCFQCRTFRKPCTWVSKLYFCVGTDWCLRWGSLFCCLCVACPLCGVCYVRACLPWKCGICERCVLVGFLFESEGSCDFAVQSVQDERDFEI